MQGITISVLSCSATELPELKRRAESILSEGGQFAARHPERRLGPYAGRAALAETFRLLELRARIRVEPDYGYLKVVDETSKPIQGLFANISHTGGVAVAAVAARPIGVDIEKISRSASRVLERICSPQERARLSDLIEIDGIPVSSSLLLWCAKESVSKGIGLGIKFGLSHFEIDLDTLPKARVSSGIRGPLGIENPAVCFRVVGDYLLSFCTEYDELSRSVSLRLLTL